MFTGIYLLRLAKSNGAKEKPQDDNKTLGFCLRSLSGVKTYAAGLRGLRKQKCLGLLFAPALKYSWEKKKENSVVGNYLDNCKVFVIKVFQIVLTNKQKQYFFLLPTVQLRAKKKITVLVVNYLDNCLSKLV